MKTAVEFIKERNELILVYSPRDDAEWVLEKFRLDKDLVIKGTFHLTGSDLVDEARRGSDDENDDYSFDHAPLKFRLGRRRGDYYSISKVILGLEVPIRIHKDCEITWKWFTAERRTSVFSVIARLRPTEITIGGDAASSIPETEFLKLLERFPTAHELHRYSLARVSAVVRQYLDTEVDAELLYQNYIEKRLSGDATDIAKRFRDSDAQKYRFLHDRLKLMLLEENSYSESRWQAEILQIVLLLNPRYIKAFQSASIKDLDASVSRQLDILLIDASGNVDIIEIKKPFEKSIVSANTYRNNHIPLRELSGSIMQIEKYIYYLNRWGAAGEVVLTQRYKGSLPKGFRINITNPKGMVIIGRDNNLSAAQLFDFEVVKRKYKSIIDIITYDDLLRRLDFLLKQLERDDS